MNRRRFIRCAAGAAAGSLLPRGLFGQTGAIVTTPLSDNLVLLTGAGCNVLAMTGPEGVVMVDGGLADRAPALLRTVGELSGGRPVTTLFNTHWHPEHTGSNLALSQAGATIVAHENTRLWLSTDITRPWENRTFQPMPREARPNRTFYTTGSITANGERIDYGYMLQAHTDGDIYIHFTKSNVLALGGLTSANEWPLIDWWTGGWIGGLANGLNTAVQATNPETRIVPASGPIMTQAGLRSHMEMYWTISQRLQQIMRRGRSVDETLESQPTKEFNETMGAPEQFVRRAFESCYPQLTPDA